ncbi:SDR family NAD(P)-dependent oxidoreductase [Rhodococcus sp. BP-149]|uniref:oxidoreductase n=1 Tax=unclassified Rhodococcus (in: high G+C Gram-positive bacteria) TaxID=192944 RepID=UPI001C9B1107|nr:MULTISPECIES: oxidoreductase [unclassified Rhodococcus (in: high G+C Gram-positive bacteria)]MBY6685334.1 SDR family NAD(P)-dependent oxidoreductase [Rhodococcus sp. BP-288]MBY6695970.1 SDR family NAD(P)-dependent oxidoreductase [Rhodococcus sp. BP-188]MBY6696964.1 SDR family NAD(P)-dependent oxidoreductase [Rhodococcus sp. BP-285]MBY6703620.1 SDR family NAD(P)-dependent oxidoreductase [Rhodococcus sp. BP-283]MBY6710426.1 SDR family NAD(P)-dependent oxidoreductase [Rhodococcus sp. BP-160]
MAQKSAHKWVETDVPDQTGRTFVVTGANSGLGAEAAKALGRAGATVVLACRTVEKAKPIADEIGERAEVRRLDLADLSSVREFADDTPTVDVLINNAGVMALPLKRTADGFEMQFGTNHLGHFALTGLLLDRITDRVVTMSSFMHQVPGLKLSDLNYEKRRYSRWGAYGQSKLSNLLFAYELDRRLRAAGSPVLSLAAHPGYSSTELMGRTETVQDAFMSLGRVFAQSAYMGSLPELYAATAPGLQSGGYFGPDGFQELSGHPKKVGSNKASRDEAKARELWTRSVELTGVTYAI